MLCFVDDLLHIGFQPNEDIDTLHFIYQVKEGFFTPDHCLGENIKKGQL